MSQSLQVRHVSVLQLHLLTYYLEYNGLAFLTYNAWYRMTYIVLMWCSKWDRMQLKFCLQCLYRKPTYSFMVLFNGIRIFPLGTILNYLYTLLPGDASGLRIPLKISFNGIFWKIIICSISFSFWWGMRIDSIKDHLENRHRDFKI